MRGSGHAPNTSTPSVATCSERHLWDGLKQQVFGHVQRVVRASVWAPAPTSLHLCPQPPPCQAEPLLQGRTVGS